VWLLGRARGVGWPGEGAGRDRRKARGEELGRGVERGNGPRWAEVRGQAENRPARGAAGKWGEGGLGRVGGFGLLFPSFLLSSFFYFFFFFSS
jgi:hypothetical protein